MTRFGFIIETSNIKDVEIAPVINKSSTTIRNYKDGTSQPVIDDAKILASYLSDRLGYFVDPLTLFEQVEIQAVPVN